MKKLIICSLLMSAFLSCKQNTNKHEAEKETSSEYVLLDGYKIDNLNLNSRKVMAPMTRCRADNNGHVSTDLMAEYCIGRTDNNRDGYYCTQWIRVPRYTRYLYGLTNSRMEKCSG